MIYIICPPYNESATGGTELLHQFGRKLIDLKVPACMYYPNTKSNRPDPVADRFKQYSVPFVKILPKTTSKDIFVSPETMTEYLYSWGINAKKVVWWLSVDFYRPITMVRRIRHFLRGKRHFYFGDKSITHFVQCEYARLFLAEKGITDVRFLSDYLSNDFIKDSQSVDLNKKINQVVYNPKKGMQYTKVFIEAAPHIKFIAIQDMTPKEIAELLAKSKVYIDFGFHPGKDRIPREAAIMGCVTIVGLSGAAKNSIDIPIDDKYKFDMDSDPIFVIEKISNFFDKYSEIASDFFLYKDLICMEEMLFEKQVQEFIDVMNARDL